MNEILNDPKDAAQFERELLGSMLHGAEFIDRIAGVVDAEDFADKDHGKLFMALLTLHAAGQPIHNVKLLAAEVAKFRGCQSVASHEYLNRIFLEVASPAHILYNAEQVRYAARKRKMLEISTELLRRSRMRDTSPDEDVAYIESHVRMMQATTPNESHAVGDIALALAKEIREKSTQGESKRPGIMTGLYVVDSVLGPIMPGEVAILSARPGCGKTSFGMQWAAHVATRGKNVLFASLEMKRRELIGRMIGPLAEVDAKTIRTMIASPDEQNRIQQAADSLHGMTLRICDKSRTTMSHIRGLAKQEAATRGLDALFVDYVGLINQDASERGMKRHEVVGGYIAELKSLAGELDVPIVCLAQVNRDSDGQMPRLSNLKESGGIEEHADAVMFIFNPDENSREETQTVNLIIAKNRHGQKGKVNVFWTPAKTLFSEAAEWTGL